MIPALLTFLALMLPGSAWSLEERCDQTTLDEIECYRRVADRAETQLEKDWNYLMQLARSRNNSSLRYFNAGHLSYRNYVQKNCESEGHDALGGSLEDVLREKCRRDTYLARHRLFERIGESHPMGRTAETVFGRPICNSFLDRSKPVAIGPNLRTGDVELLRQRLDKKAVQAIDEGFHASVKSLLRSTHGQAESLRTADAVNTCQGILMAFCPHVSNLGGGPSDIEAEWLSRCQTEIRSAYYKRATQRLRQLQLLESSN